MSLIIASIIEKSNGKVKNPKIIVGISKRKTNILNLKKDELPLLVFCL